MSLIEKGLVNYYHWHINKPFPLPNPSSNVVHDTQCRKSEVIPLVFGFVSLTNYFFYNKIKIVNIIFLNIKVLSPNTFFVNKYL